MKKPLVGLSALILILSLTFTGCGMSDDRNTTSSTTTTTTTRTTTTTTAATTGSSLSSTSTDLKDDVTSALTELSEEISDR